MTRQAQAVDGAVDPTVQRVRRIIGAVDLDCRCRAALEDTLERFTAIEAKRHGTEKLRAAKAARLSIAGLLELLAELDEIDSAEPDRSVFGELACIFDAVGAKAAEGARALRELGGV